MKHKELSILFMGLHYKKEDEQKLLKICKGNVSAAHYTLEENLIRGLRYYAKVDLITSLPIGSYPKMSHKILIQSSTRDDRKEIGFINIPFLKDIIREYKIEKEICKWVEGCPRANQKVILIYDAIVPFIKAAVKIKKRDDSINNIIIVPDLPGKYSVEHKMYGAIISSFLKYKEKMFYDLIKRLDAYILLTKYMADVMGIENKPRLIMECVISPQSDNLCKIVENDPKIIMYAGELSSNVDMDVLLEAIKYININIELWICGTGSYESHIKKRARYDERIKFWGFIPKDQLEKMQCMVDVFVNPRQNQHLYTRYSFPSKNAEYLNTGKPLVAYKLDGIPNEYDQYIFYPDSNMPQDMAKTITKVLSMSATQLEELYTKQTGFMKNNKSEKAQGRKIINFLRGL